MEYKGKNYNIVLTYECTNCKAVDFINPEVKPYIDICDNFMDFALGNGQPVPLDSRSLTHICNRSGNAVTIAPMTFTHIEVREIKPEVAAENEKTETNNKGEDDGPD